MQLFCDFLFLFFPCILKQYNDKPKFISWVVKLPFKWTNTICVIHGTLETGSKICLLPLYIFLWNMVPWWPIGRGGTSYLYRVPAALLPGPRIMKSKRVKCSCCTPFKNPCCYSLLHLYLYTSTLCDGPSCSALPRQEPTLGWYGFAFSNAFFSNIGTSNSSHSSGYGAADPKTVGGNSVGHHRIWQPAAAHHRHLHQRCHFCKATIMEIFLGCLCT